MRKTIENIKDYILALILVVLMISCTQKTEVVEQKATITPQEEKTNSIIEAPSSLDEKFAYVYGYQLLNSIMLTMPELEKDYFMKVGTLDVKWMASEFTKALPKGLFRKANTTVQQLYDCLSFVVYLDFLKNTKE